MAQNNPLMQKTKLPGKVFQLPSMGAFYEKGVLADTVMNGEVQVKPMSALTELKIRTADLLISGKVWAEVCEECVPDVLQPINLVAKDVDALFCFLIISTYGPSKEIKAIHDCVGAKMHDYKIDLDKIISEPNNSALTHKDMLYRCDLSNGQTVHLKPVTYEDSILLMNIRSEINRFDMEGGRSIPRELLEKMVIADMMAVITSVEDVVNGERIVVNNRIHIDEWLKSLSKKFTNEIAAASIKASEWGFVFSQDIVCKDCQQKFSYDIELNPVTFFSG